MRYLSILFVVFVVFEADVYGQGGKKNIKPDIIGQKSVSTNEDQSITIQLTDLYVIDWDDSYPKDFTLEIMDGNHYTFLGSTITPEKNFNGTLRVPVRVNDGDDYSKPYEMKIQVDKVNDQPVITGQVSLSINENQPITVQLTNLVVVDDDNKYPDDFKLKIQPGNNYTVSGNTVTPVQNFTGTLVVIVKVNDGNSDSPPFDLKVQVISDNDVPVITNQKVLTTNQNQSLTISLSDLTVSDADNKYPDDFTLDIFSGANYSVSGLVITPSQNFNGDLAVKITVNDGKDDSAPFTLKIKVKPANAVPVITAQVPIFMNEEEGITLLLTHLKVTDPDNVYPRDFTLTATAGENYEVMGGNVIHPTLNFNGNLTVNVTVSDGTNVSSPFGVQMIVNPINDAPEITNLETVPLSYQMGSSPVILTREFEVIDVDDDSLSIAEIKFSPGYYGLGNDELIFNNTTNIRGVFDSRDGILSLIGKAPVSEYRNAIRSIQYTCNLTENDSIIKNKTVYINLNDGKNVSQTRERQIILNDNFVNLDIPSGFTPNGDSANDTWSVKPLKTTDQFANPTVRVYTKTGRLVYEKTGFDNAWDGIFNGEFLPADTYYYTIDLNLPYSNATHKGLVTILR